MNLDIKNSRIIKILKLFNKNAKSLKICKMLLNNKSGIEIGGPSHLFSGRGILPIYPFIKNLDNCNFSSHTLWEGEIHEGRSFKFNDSKGVGNQFILEATNLYKLSSESYDFVLSSHVIEHIANPIKALNEWKRILKIDGILVIVIPHKEGTFDHKRNITPLSHMVEDYNKNASESDLTHLKEILKLHDLTMDPLAGSAEQFNIRSNKNFENRCLHHHVFNTYSAVQLIDYMRLKILFVEAIMPFHIIIIAKKEGSFNNYENLNIFKNNKFKSPFKTDKLIEET